MAFRATIADMLPRLAADRLRLLRDHFPVLLITGPRQSGKSTLAQTTVGDLEFLNLEDPMERARWRSVGSTQPDFRAFFQRYPDGAIIDEAQHVPDLFPALQAQVDRDRRMGRWILTGSQQFVLSQAIGQSLAGRAASVELLGFSHAELMPSTRRPSTLAQAVFQGGYPAIYDDRRPGDPVEWLNAYAAAFIGKDVGDLLGIRDRTTFARFMAQCAALSGREVNNAKLAADLQVATTTIEKWLSVLESAYLIIRMRAYHRNFGKRLAKQPRLYFLDSGLACRLLHIGDVNQLQTHPLWGSLVETWCVGEILKGRWNRGKQAPLGLSSQLYLWRTSDGHEVDLVIDLGDRLLPVEIKAGQSPTADLGAGLRKLRQLNARDRSVTIQPGIVIYGGQERTMIGEDQAVPWNAIDQATELWA
jgi:predicted AAA+ superfamily ATPase